MSVAMGNRPAYVRDINCTQTRPLDQYKQCAEKFTKGPKKTDIQSHLSEESYKPMPLSMKMNIVESKITQPIILETLNLKSSQGSDANKHKESALTKIQPENTTHYKTVPISKLIPIVTVNLATVDSESARLKNYPAHLFRETTDGEPDSRNELKSVVSSFFSDNFLADEKTHPLVEPNCYIVNKDTENVQRFTGYKPMELNKSDFTLLLEERMKASTMKTHLEINKAAKDTSKTLAADEEIKLATIKPKKDDFILQLEERMRASNMGRNLEETMKGKGEIGPNQNKAANPEENPSKVKRDEHTDVQNYEQEQEENQDSKNNNVEMKNKINETSYVQSQIKAADERTHCSSRCPLLGLCRVERTLKVNRCNVDMLANTVSTHVINTPTIKDKCALPVPKRPLHIKRPDCNCDLCTIAFLTDVPYPPNHERKGPAPIVQGKQETFVRKVPCMEDKNAYLNVVNKEINIIEKEKPRWNTIKVQFRDENMFNQNGNKENTLSPRFPESFKCGDFGKDYNDVLIVTLSANDQQGSIVKSDKNEHCLLHSQSSSSDLALSQSSVSTIMSYKRVKQIFQTIIEENKRGKKRRMRRNINKFREMEELGLGRLMNNRWYPNDSKTFSIWNNITSSVQGIQVQFKKNARGHRTNK